MAIISIFSGSYCDGGQVAELVCQQLKYDRIDEILIDETSKRFSVESDKLIRTMSGTVPMLNRFTHEREKNAANLRLVLAELLVKDNLVLHGHAAHLVGEGISHVLRVCVIANFDYRIKKLMDSEGLSEKEAHKIIHREDEGPQEWTKYLFDKAAYDKTLYDIMVPMHETSVEKAAELICDHARSQPLQTTKESQAAAEDAVLAARVNLTLVEAGQTTSVTSRAGNVSLMIDHDAVSMSQYKDKLKKIVTPIEGVKAVEFKISPKFHAAAANPWANIETPPKVLLVDDEKEFVQTLSERLQVRNFDSSVVYDGEQALDFVNADEPDVMVVDLMMPGIDGIEVLRRVKQEHPYVEVIILTGHGSDREETLARQLGAFAYLKKPVGIDVLTQTMKDAYHRVNEVKASMKGDKPTSDSDTDG